MYSPSVHHQLIRQTAQQHLLPLNTISSSFTFQSCQLDRFLSHRNCKGGMPAPTCLFRIRSAVDSALDFGSKGRRFDPGRIRFLLCLLASPFSPFACCPLCFRALPPLPLPFTSACYPTFWIYKLLPFAFWLDYCHLLFTQPHGFSFACGFIKIAFCLPTP